MSRSRIRELLSALSPGFRRIIGNTGWLLVDRIVRMGLGVLITVWMARHLGPVRFGSLNFAISFVALFGTFATFGLESIVVREIVRNPSEANEILGTGFGIRIAGSFLAPLLALCAIKTFLPHDFNAMLLVATLSLGFVFQAFDTISWYFQSQVQSKLTVWAATSAFFLVSIGRCYLIETDAPLWEFAAAQVVEVALCAVGLIVAYRYCGGRISLWRGRHARAIELLKQSWPVILSGMAIMIFMRIDMVMLKAMQGDRAVGIYSAATRVSEVWYFIPMAIVSSVTPAIIRARDNSSLYYGRLRRLFSLMSFLALTIGSVLAFASHWIIHILYSDAYDAASPILSIHVWASLFVFLGVAQSPWDFSEGHLRLGFYRTLAGAISNILLNLLLIPKYSAMGAAIATVISYSISGVFGNVFSVVTRPIFFMQLRSFRFTDILLKDDVSEFKPHRASDGE